MLRQLPEQRRRRYKWRADGILNAKVVVVSFAGIA